MQILLGFYWPQQCLFFVEPKTCKLRPCCNSITVDEAIDGGASTQTLKAQGPKEKKANWIPIITNFVQKVFAVHTRALAFPQKNQGFKKKIW